MELTLFAEALRTATTDPYLDIVMNSAADRIEKLQAEILKLKNKE